MIGELKRTKVMRNGARRAIDTEDPFGLPLKRNFVLPDFQSIQRGYVKPYDEMMRDSEQVNMAYFIASFKCLHVLYHYNNNDYYFNILLLICFIHTYLYMNRRIIITIVIAIGDGDGAFLCT